MTSYLVDSRRKAWPPLQAMRVLVGPYVHESRLWLILVEWDSVDFYFVHLQAWYSDDGETWAKVDGPSTDEGVFHRDPNDHYGVTQIGSVLRVAYFRVADTDEEFPNWPMRTVDFDMATSSWGAPGDLGYSADATVPPAAVLPLHYGGSTHYVWQDVADGNYCVKLDGVVIDGGGQPDGIAWYLCHAWVAGDGRPHIILAKVVDSWTENSCDLYHYSDTLTVIGPAYAYLDIPWVAAADYDDGGTRKIIIAYQSDPGLGIVTRRASSSDAPTWSAEEPVMTYATVPTKSTGHEVWGRLVARSSSEIYLFACKTVSVGFASSYRTIYQSVWNGSAWSAPGVTAYDRTPGSIYSIHTALVPGPAIGVALHDPDDVYYWEIPLLSPSGNGPAARYYSF